MAGHVVIDGNNLLYAMHANAPVANVGRETLVKVIERWARPSEVDVTLVYDGPVPREGLAKQMTSSRIRVCFSESLTADDVIVSLIHQERDPGTLRVISSDTAIMREARRRRSRVTDAASFVAELFPPADHPRPAQPAPPEKPEHVSAEETEEWLETFGCDEIDDDLRNAAGPIEE